MATDQSNVTAGTIIGGSEDQFGITLHVVKTVDGELCGIGFDFYPPDDPLFAWAIEILAQINAS